MKTVNLNRIIASLSILFILSPGFGALAQENTKTAAAHKNEFSLTVTTLPEVQAKYQHTGFFRENLEYRAGASVSPVSVNALFDTVWTPLPFAQLVGSSSVGSGWNSAMADGLRINEHEGDHDNRLSGGPLAGAVYSAGLGGALQFDYAALVPGKWNHIVARSFHTVFYRGLSSAAEGESWMFEADPGENRNGFNYYGNLFVGYKMPLRLNLAGVLIEAERYLYDEKNGDDWGDNLVRWSITPMLSAQLTEKLSATFMTQFRTQRNFTDETEDYGFYKDRLIDRDDPRHFEFYRVILSLGYIL